MSEEEKETRRQQASKSRRKEVQNRAGVRQRGNGPKKGGSKKSIRVRPGVLISRESDSESRKGASCEERAAGRLIRKDQCDLQQAHPSDKVFAKN